ncbi:hypothetical protein DPMN_106152 [Dreissena polymorpha]|uniref:Uncharacterized protein n=1 Tax=Dreissena polymorpha TaxID=45954 RepID=A0A9D4K4L0_DREPO|nr:hypothetical protein DPMN_106152 [Dreissena polymorpha]
MNRGVGMLEGGKSQRHVTLQPGVSERCSQDVEPLPNASLCYAQIQGRSSEGYYAGTIPFYRGTRPTSSLYERHGPLK